MFLSATKVFGRDDYYLCQAIMYGNYFFNYLYMIYGCSVYDEICFENKEPCGRGKKINNNMYIVGMAIPLITHCNQQKYTDWRQK